MIDLLAFGRYLAGFVICPYFIITPTGLRGTFGYSIIINTSKGLFKHISDHDKGSTTRVSPTASTTIRP
jgi:hypothetical protein